MDSETSDIDTLHKELSNRKAGHKRKPVSKNGGDFEAGDRFDFLEGLPEGEYSVRIVWQNSVAYEE